VTCKSCSSDNLRKFATEVAVHFPFSENTFKAHVYLFPEILVCLKCGNAQFAIDEDHLRLLAEDNAAAAGAS
jgi:ribosomal protein L40E